MTLPDPAPLLPSAGFDPAGCPCGCHQGGHPTHLKPCCATPGFPDPAPSHGASQSSSPPTPSYLPPEPGLLCGGCGALVGESMRAAHDEFHLRLSLPSAAAADSHPPVSGTPLPYPQADTTPLPGYL